MTDDTTSDTTGDAGADTGRQSGRDTTATALARGPGYRKLFTASVITNLGDGVGTVAYPWLASAVTRNPALIAGVAIAQRLPWLVFTLPAGVITDRVDRRKAMVTMDVLRGVLTLMVALVVLGQQSTLPSPDEVNAVVGTRWFIYGILLLATLLLGMAEVLATTRHRRSCRTSSLQRISRRQTATCGAPGIANTFVGPPLGSLLVAVTLALPFLVGPRPRSSPPPHSSRSSPAPSHPVAPTTPNPRTGATT